jgi:CheY-like chemotaxis protein
MGMGQELELGRMEGAPAAVALLTARDSSALAVVLAELDPTALSVVVWPSEGKAPSEAELWCATRQSGFRLACCWDGIELEPGNVHVIPPCHDVWFEGQRLRVTARAKAEQYPFDRALESLARVWGRGSVALATGERAGDGERGLSAVRQAGGVVLATQCTSTGGRGSPVARLAEVDAVPEARSPMSPPRFRVQRLFPFSSLTLERLRMATELAVRRAAQRDRVRAWVPACKTGGLAYAVAMLLRSAIAKAGSSQRVLVFGTDDDEEALAVARTGTYPARAALGMDPELREAFAFDEGERIRLSESLRQACIFSSHELTRDAPFSRIDLVVCQRLFHGLSFERRTKVIHDLHFALRKEGVLFAVDRGRHFEGEHFQAMPEGYLKPRSMPCDRERWLGREFGATPDSLAGSTRQAAFCDHAVSTLELAISTAAAVAGSWSDLGNGLENALRRVLPAEALEIWVESPAGSELWQRRFPESRRSHVPVCWPDERLDVSRPWYQPPTSPSQPGELWWPVSAGDGTAAMLRVFGRSLRAPDPNVTRALEQGARTVGSCCRRLVALDDLLKRESSYRRRAAELEAFFAALPLCASIHDGNGSLRHVTRRLARERDASSGNGFEQVYSRALPPWIARVLGTREPVLDLDLSLAEGEAVRAWRCDLAPLRDDEGALLGVAAVVQDERGPEHRAAQKPSPPVEARAPASGRAARRRRLLLVATRADTAEKVAALFGPSELEIERACSAEAALSALRVRRPDLILCDVDLPAMSAFELAESVRADEDWRDMQLIALVDDEDALTRLRVAEAGFDQYLTKPVDLDALWQCLSQPATAPLARRR